MLDKVRVSDLKTPFSEDEMKTYYQFINLSEEENLLIEKYGLDIRKIGNNYEVVISIGFDDWVAYKTEGACWHGTKNIAGLKLCSKNR